MRTKTRPLDLLRLLMILLRIVSVARQQRTLRNFPSSPYFCGAFHGIAKSWTRLSDWKTVVIIIMIGCVCVCVCVCVCACAWAGARLVTLCNHMDCSPPGSSVHGILQAKILEWVAISFSRGSSKPRDWIWVSCILGRFFTICGEGNGNPL